MNTTCPICKKKMREVKKKLLQCQNPKCPIYNKNTFSKNQIGSDTWRSDFKRLLNKIDPLNE